MLIAGVQPLMLVLGLVSVWGYLRRSGRTPGWPARRTSTFIIGVALVLALSCGPIAVAARQAFWIWVSQSLALLLVVPLVIMGGQPLELWRPSARPGAARTSRWDGLRRAISSPVLGAGLVPVTCALLLFGPVPGWSIGVPVVGWITQLALLGVGLVLAYPLIAIGQFASSTALGLATAVGLVELLLDAVPGIVMRLSTHPVTNFFDYRVSSAGQLGWLHDQQVAGAILWCTAELLDLPFLILVFRRWIAADERESREVDASLPPVGGPDDGQPWFLTDPQLRDRFR